MNEIDLLRTAVLVVPDTKSGNVNQFSPHTVKKPAVLYLLMINGIIFIYDQRDYIYLCLNFL